jgi:hypothetical protein
MILPNLAFRSSFLSIPGGTKQSKGHEDEGIKRERDNGGTDGAFGLIRACGSKRNLRWASDCELHSTGGAGDDLCQFNPDSAAGKKILKTCKLGDACKAVVSFQQCSKDAEICGPGGDIETVYSVERVIKRAMGRAKGHPQASKA